MIKLQSPGFAVFKLLVSEIVQTAQSVFNVTEVNNTPGKGGIWKRKERKESREKGKSEMQVPGVMSLFAHSMCFTTRSSTEQTLCHMKKQSIVVLSLVLH